MAFETIDTSLVATAAVAEASQKIVQEFAFVQGLVNTGITYLQTYSWQIVAAIIIFIIGLVLSNWTQRLVIKTGSKNEKLDPTLLNFLAGVSRILVLALTIMVTLSKLGITIAPLIAALSAGVFGATFAIQAPIANYAAGLAIILSRPFRLGDLITIHGISGRVESITLPMTYLRDNDGELIQIPNKRIIGEIIENSQELRLVAGKVGISYGCDPEEAIRLISEAISAIEGVVSEPPVRVGINSFGDSSIEIAYRCRVQAEHNYSVKYKINSEVFRVLKEANIEIPFPQRVVTMAK